MTPGTVAIVVACISAVVALISAVGVEGVRRRAANDLRSRIYNLHRGFRDPAGDQDYFVENLTGPDIARLVEVQHALVDLIDGFDPNHVRFGSNRGRIPTAF